MPNTSLPTSITPNVTTGIAADLEVVNAEMNRMSRDTGWCNIAGLLKNGWGASVARIRRYDERVVVEFAGLDAAAMTNALIFSFGANESSDVSSNFAPEGGAYRLPPFEATSGRVQFYGNGGSGLNALFFEGTTLGSGFTLQLTWSTFKGWPNFLPPAA